MYRDCHIYIYRLPYTYTYIYTSIAICMNIYVCLLPGIYMYQCTCISDLLYL